MLRCTLLVYAPCVWMKCSLCLVFSQTLFCAAAHVHVAFYFVFILAAGSLQLAVLDACYCEKTVFKLCISLSSFVSLSLHVYESADETAAGSVHTCVHMFGCVCTFGAVV